VGLCHTPPLNVAWSRSVRVAAIASSVMPLACSSTMIGNTLALNAAALAALAAWPLACSSCRLVWLHITPHCALSAANAALLREPMSFRSFSPSAAYGCRMNGSMSAPSSATINLTPHTIRPEMNATSRLRRFSTATMITASLPSLLWRGQCTGQRDHLRRARR
jgi:hypothetical protein